MVEIKEICAAVGPISPFIDTTEPIYIKRK